MTAQPTSGSGPSEEANRRALAHLVGVLKLEQIDRDIFRGQNEYDEGARLFGGQVAAQALAAAQRCVDGHRAHSLHGYFLRSGDPLTPVIYVVDRIRDGRSFSTRRVVALQDGAAILNMSVSFQTDESGYDHQIEMPDVPAPETLPTWAQRADELEGKIPDDLVRWMRRPRAVETRSSLSIGWGATEPSREPNALWFRVTGELPEDSDVHQQVLTYTSDMGLLDNMHRPHRQADGPEMMMASLDHALWFHRPIALNDWVLYYQDSPSAAAARGFSRGSIFSRDGQLLASTAQEGLMRTLD